MSRPETEELPTVGAVFFDSARNVFGEFRGASPEAHRYALRPIGGGREWDADPAYLREATGEERLSARVDVENARSRNSLGMQSGGL